ncbi:hypothetical protein MPH_00829 [Macrophomina phaseolina MS6]|uniref:Uncharacterized protein n=1 Tax=Macrophomina phaseolina (strain MS6) TaxID=1126212 RepID=K2SHG9_MACPH|nr:hypothetical protein MPH_00829 [Macrophomina phaseolina MS6]
MNIPRVVGEKKKKRKKQGPVSYFLPNTVCNAAQPSALPLDVRGLRSFPSPSTPQVARNRWNPLVCLRHRLGQANILPAPRARPRYKCCTMMRFAPAMADVRRITESFAFSSPFLPTAGMKVMPREQEKPIWFSFFQPFRMHVDVLSHTQRKLCSACFCSLVCARNLWENSPASRRRE